MLPLAGSPLPDSPQTLAKGLVDGLAAHGVAAREVAVEGTWPALDLLRIDLTGSEISPARIPSRASDARDGSVTASRLEILAAPGEVQGIPLHVRLHARDAGFGFAPLEDDEASLLLEKAADGNVTVEVARADLDRLIHSLASKAAGEHGVEIKSVTTNFSTRGPRALSMTAEVVAKMFIATATLKLSGDVDIDEQLNARLSNLRFQGDGMVANLAGGFIRPQLAAFEGRTFPLMKFALGVITLRDVQIEAESTLRLSARFAG